MIETLLWIVALGVSLIALSRGSEVFVYAAEAIGMSAGLSPFLIGVTVVAIGTSLPELVSGIVAVLAGAPEIAISTAVGSNITNILLVLSLAALVGGGLKVDYEVIRVDLPFLFGSALMLVLFAFDGVIGRAEALLSLAAATVYIVYAAIGADPGTTVAATASEIQAPGAVTRRTFVKLVGGAVVIQLGAYYTVESVLRLSELMEIGSDVIAASAIALGTSLPELSVSVQSARAGKPELAVGNVIGSNVFNALGVVGGAALFGPIVASPTIIEFALPAMIGATVLCFFVLQEREMTRWDGWLLLILYVGFNGELFHFF